MDSELRRRGSFDDDDEKEADASFADIAPSSASASSGADTQETGNVLAYFMLYSMAMFTLPFLAFIGTKYSLQYYLSMDGFASLAWSVVAAVVVVNTIIIMYACKGYRDEIESEEMASQQQSKTDLNMKSD